ncbi:hypothetical protein ABK905_02185 [Acerihabitans sp. KWT182]|uniref:Big-1 domain-containing protein n=1 Tax=Acerihabitans sp. KWT182 TaxID=3157919 RepID=A0AAU7QA81_9GAMM
MYLTRNTPGQVLVSASVVGTAGATNNTFLVFSEVAVFNLTSNTQVNYQPAGGATGNVIVFTLTRNGVPVANERMSFSTIPASASVSADAATGPNGSVTAYVTSPYAGEVEVTAVVDNQPSVQPIHVIVTFTEPVRLYFIANEVVTDHARAGSGTPNQVRFTVYSLDNFTPQPGIVMDFSVTGSAQLPASTGTTGADGTILVNVLNNVAQPVTLTARIRSEPLTDSHVDLNFSLL